MQDNFNDNKNIEKIVSETFQNPDVMSFIVKQIKDQFEKEQSKAEQNKKNIDEIKSKADNYTSNNAHLNKYISERDKYMDVFKKVTERVNTENVNIEKENTQEPSKKTWTQNTSQVSMMHNFSDGWYKWCQETTDGKIIGNIFFDLIRGNNNNFDTFLNIYSILNLYADEWENWEVDHYDWEIPNHPISKLIDSYCYEFTKEESKIIDSMEDTVYSYTHVEIDNELPMVSIYIMDYSKKTNKVYDFNRIIFTPSDNASENDRQLFYYDLYKYLNNPSTIETVLEDFCYTFINKHIIHGVSDFPTTDKEYYNLMHTLITYLLEEKKNGIKIEFKKEDSPDKTNSILDKLGIPHDNGVVDIPISDDKFISNRINNMNKASEILKSWFDIDDEEEMKDEVDEVDNEDKSCIDCFVVDTGTHCYDSFLAKAIKDGHIKVELLSPEYVYLNIDGTRIFMINPYGNNL